MAHWCFTLNNPDGNLDVTLNNDAVRYATWQMEMGDEGTNHFQGYLELQRSQRIEWLARLIPGAHFERRRGTREQARSYARKDDTRIEGPWEIGQWDAGGQGNRTDIAAFKQAVDSGKKDLELWDEMPGMYLRYEKMLSKIRSLKQPRRNWKTHVTLVYGNPGLGKSYWCRQQAPDAYWKAPNNKWFDTYDRHEDVVMDDYKAWLPWSTILQLMDEGPCKVESKGSFCEFLARRMFITTNFLPSDWYNSSEDSKQKYPIRALTRRVNSWKHFLEGPDFAEDPRDVIINSYDDYDSFIQAVVNYRAPNRELIHVE